MFFNQQISSTGFTMQNNRGHQLNQDLKQQTPHASPLLFQLQPHTAPNILFNTPRILPTDIQPFELTSITSIPTLSLNHTTTTANNQIQSSSSTSTPPFIKATKKKKPPNSFILYRREKARQIHMQDPGIDNREVSRRIADMWRNEPESVKLAYRLQELQYRQVMSSMDDVITEQLPHSISFLTVPQEHSFDMTPPDPQFLLFQDSSVDISTGSLGLEDSLSQPTANYKYESMGGGIGNTSISTERILRNDAFIPQIQNQDLLDRREQLRQTSPLQFMARRTTTSDSQKDLHNQEESLERILSTTLTYE